ncbi:MAG: TetR/AcrR family transcriptional regulator of autoinduction and epiphytic fitness [Phenylobacterium sp.]|jgi:TetR/AcrR family transcriptional regulator of autoinduction and epiphytic fitness
MARSSKKRDAIVAAAIAEFKANGYQATSMDQISLTAAVSKRTVYNHFASKELLFDAIVMQMLALVSTSVSLSYAVDKPLDVQLTTIGQQEVALLGNQAFVDLAKVCVAEAMHSPQRINEALTRVEGREGDLTSWLTAATTDGRLAIDDVQFAATQFFGLIKSFCFWPQMVQGQPFPDETRQQAIVQSAVAMFLALYTLTDAHGQ